MTDDRPIAPDPLEGRGWVRAAALLGTVFALSVVRPGVLIAVPLLLLLLMGRERGGAVFAVAALSMLVVATGPRDGLWYAERAWSLIVGGWFVAFTLARPAWKLSARAVAAVLASTLVAAGFFLVRDGWSALDFTISSGVVASVTTTLDALAVLREGQPMSPAFVAAMYEMAEAQASVFPALLGLASIGALGVAWWVTARLTEGDDGAIGPAAAFRFNDHLVWIMIGGLVLVVARWGDVLSRVGVNAMVFMGALYALRGAGVVMFLSGGLSVAGYVLLAFGLLFAAPAVLGAAILIGIGDTWLDVRARASGQAT